jgi:hypothetical protein
VAASNKVVERKLKSMAEQGWEVLADSYPDIMRTAIEVAMGRDNALPNVMLLKTLLELMVKVAGADQGGNETVTDALVKGFIDDVRANRVTAEPAVGNDKQTNHGPVDGGHLLWPGTNTPIPGMGKGLQFDRP